MTEYQGIYDKSIAISALVQAYRCPRRYYFSLREPVPVSDRYTICKQISYAGKNTDEDSLWNEICMIHPDINPEMREYLSESMAVCSHTPFLPWSETEISIRSDRYGIHGLIDKYHPDSQTISIIRPSRAPEHGCWTEDRIRIAACLICLKEQTGIAASGGQVEYIPDGIIRYCEPQPRDRRRLLQGLTWAREVQKGNLPQKPVHPPCKKCQYMDRCEPPKARTLSELLFKKR